MSETHEIAEKISEAHEHGEHSSAAFRTRMGMVIGFVACALAITAVGGSKAMQETINANIESSDDYAFYQAKTLRKEIVVTASEALGTLLATPNLSDDAKAAILKQQDVYAREAAHWDSDPKENNGIKELLSRAKEAAEKREQAETRNAFFEFAEAALQIAVVTASTSVLLVSRSLAAICFLFALIGGACSIWAFSLLLL